MWGAINKKLLKTTNFLLNHTKTDVLNKILYTFRLTTMGAILCIMGDKLCQEWQGSTLEYQGNKQNLQRDTLEYERYDQEYQDYINTFYMQGVFDHDAYEREEKIFYPYVNMKKKRGNLPEITF